MASVKLSGIGVTDIRGKLGGNVFSKGRSGNTLRNKVVPINPQTSSQIAQRAKLSLLASAWRNLTSAQQLQWNAVAASGMYPKVNIFGDKIQPSGFQLFVNLNLNILIAGGTQIVVPPRQLSLTNITFDSFNADGLEIAYTGTLGANEVLVIFSTAPMSAGRTRVPKSNLRITTTSTVVSPFSFSTEYDTLFGGVIVTAKIFAKVVLVDKTTGAVALLGIKDGIVP